MKARQDGRVIRMTDWFARDDGWTTRGCGNDSSDKTRRVLLRLQRLLRLYQRAMRRIIRSCSSYITSHLCLDICSHIHSRWLIIVLPSI